MTLGERLRGLREDHDLRQIDVAQQIKVLQASLSNYELDINQPDLSTLVKLANFYHVNIDYLLGNTDVKTSWKDYTEQVKLKDRVVSSGSLVENLNQLSIVDREHLVGIIESLAAKNKA
ncbi:HTH-type transcriptional regulator immR [uncultured Ruminococcus sp.]|uniref:helix-turn-helix domain-containing protein n=1 Tax=Massiliimalia timonensis TaxID=1987501 RepID=UPI0008212782|nr:helix-turn-helix transcriptional regulator [Massiliimalia timonensis]MBS7175402.1 helix-turn-helix transcriptional regulator [Clostridiales bacterium]SCH34345.1 HTH-type transcriptional regulator immR [uncultured Ruminococcus sp.]SCH36812.1 HTH-type transcriptional regulator immR [uncultured Clostridium sp.]